MHKKRIKMKEFKYDVVKLIRNVRDRPCLWDKTCNNYKDRIDRRNAWQEIFNDLDEGYEDMNPEEKRITGENILAKWTNIRDTFLKSLRHRPGKPKKKYVLYNHLTFLKKLPEDDSNANSIPDDEQPTSHYVKQETPVRPVRKKKLDCVDYNLEFVTKRSRSESEGSETNACEEVSNISFVGIDPDTSARLMNEDEAFFASLLPTVVNYNEDERLQFRIEVLSLMKRIRDKRNVKSDY